MYLLLTIIISIIGFFSIMTFPSVWDYYFGISSNSDFLIRKLTDAGIISIVSVAVCTLLAVSPVGEWFTRLMLGARKTIGREQAVLAPIIENLTEQVTKKGKTINVRSYVVDDPYPLGYAIGKGTIVVTSGLLNQADTDEIAGVLAHEFGHLYHEDTKRSLAQWGALLPFILYYKLWMAIINFLGKFNNGILSIVVLGLYVFIIPFKLIIELWALIGRKVSQRIEYRADAFAADLGERDGLVRVLERYSEIDHKKWGLAEQLMSTHPPTMYRIGKLEDIE